MRTIPIVDILAFPEIILAKMIREFLKLFGGSECLQRYIILVLGVMDTSRNPEILNMRGFGLP